MKKGEGSMWYIVEAGLALVVLVVLLAIFTGQTGMIGKKYDNIAKPTNSAAEKTGWCISTLTQGKQCGYPLSCEEIGSRLGGKGEKINLENTACNGQKTLHTYSESEEAFCCVTFP